MENKEDNKSAFAWVILLVVVFLVLGLVFIGANIEIDNNTLVLH